MYNPRHFAENDLPTLQDFMEQYNFAILAASRDGGPFATHLPFVLERGRGRFGTLIAHVAKPNPNVADIEAGREVLVIFSGPHAYVSPRWYVNERNVPTWNYTAAHAYGRPRVVEPEGVLQRLVEQHDPEWKFDADADWIRRMYPAIVCFEIEIERLEGKFKLSQNRAAEDREGALQALASSEDPTAREVAKLMVRRTVQKPT